MSYFETHSENAFVHRKLTKTTGLRPPQVGAVFAVASHLTGGDEVLPALVVMPTGAGKTAVATLCPFLLHAKRVLVIVPSKMLRGQTVKQWRELSVLRSRKIIPNLPSPKVAEIKSRLETAEDYEKLKQFDVVVALPNSVSPSYPNVLPPPPGFFDLVIIDEAHHVPAETWQAINNVCVGAKKVLFTATPFRRDRKEIFGKLVYVYTMQSAYRDGVYGKIRYVQVPTSAEGDDVALALEAEKVLEADRAANLNHRMMVRTQTIKKAEELHELYSKRTGLKLELVTSKYEKDVDSLVTRLSTGEIDGVVCVDMLGEGFDLPQLKIAVLHAPHRSLAVTLQFIGRFARTVGDGLGEAKVLAVPSSEIRIEAETLYREGAVWQEIIQGLNDDKVEETRQVREVIDRFETWQGKLEADANLSLYSLRPKLNASIYRPLPVPDLTADPGRPTSADIVFRAWDDATKCAVLVLKNLLLPLWTSGDRYATLEHSLVILHLHEESGLFFVHATGSSESLVKEILIGYGIESLEPIPLNEINRLFLDVTVEAVHSIGLRPKTPWHEAYRTTVGSRTEDSLMLSDGSKYDQGHVFAKVKGANSEGTIGYSSNSKLWSNSNGSLAHFIAWCDAAAKKIIDTRAVVTGTSLDVVATGSLCKEFPPEPFGADHDGTVYEDSPQILAESPAGKFSFSLCDSELTTVRLGSSKLAVDLLLEADGHRIQIAAKVDGTYELVSVDGAGGGITAVTEFGGDTLCDYLAAHPPSLFFNDGSKVTGRQLFSPTSWDTSFFDKALIEPVDWSAENVNPKKEFIKGRLDGDSIHCYLARRLVAEAWDVVYYDHRTGELGDFICVGHDGKSIVVAIYHCKGMKGKKPNERVEDIYEVAGQVVKCLRYLTAPRYFAIHVRNRTKPSEKWRYLKGDEKKLTDIVQELGVERKVQIFLVQPGISQGGISPNTWHNLAAADNYVRNMGALPLKVIGSA